MAHGCQGGMSLSKVWLTELAGERSGRYSDTSVRLLCVQQDQHKSMPQESE